MARRSAGWRCRIAGPLFFLSAAEHSGDALGAAVIAALQRRHPDATFLGIGGPRMKAAGCEMIAEPVHRAAMGPGAIVHGARYWWRLLKQVRQTLTERRPAVVVPIDSSSANLRVARVAKELQLPVCYYVAPQVWASRPWRVRKIRQVVDTLCCILPFEEGYFRSRGVHGVYVGHPMFDTPERPPETDPAQLAPALPGIAGEPVEVDAINASRTFAQGELVPRVVVLPGSRRAEVDANLPPMLEVLAAVRRQYGQVHAVAVLPSEERAQQVRKLLPPTGFEFLQVRVGQTDAAVRWADVALVKSGTSVLQIARLSKPLVVIYAAAAWKWYALRWLIITKYFTLPNIISGRAVYPEFIPHFGSSSPVAAEMLRLLGDPAARAGLARELAAIVAPLKPAATGGLAADRVAAEVSRLAEQNHKGKR